MKNFQFKENSQDTLAVFYNHILQFYILEKGNSYILLNVQIII